MGVFDKIKNALFEEEYVEVEEKPKKTKKEKLKKEVIKEKNEDRPIAKKVVLPERKETHIEELDEELLDEDFEIKPNKVVEKAIKDEVKNDFKIMDDNDFRVEEEFHEPEVEPQIVKVIEKEEVSKPFYNSKPVEKQPYGIDESTYVPVREYGGAYEKKEERKQFKPSPIISPIYGILDKNYKKDDVVTRKEVRLTSSYARENLSVDDVRKKAYGTLKDELEKELEEKPLTREEAYSFEVDDSDDDSLLVDLSVDDDKPAVKEVTMGDALEYFQDLGLEYNVDYVDASKEKTVGRREKNSYDEGFEVNKLEEKEEKEKERVIEKKVELVEKKVTIEEKTEDVDIDSDDNLFDLIDSMYKED